MNGDHFDSRRHFLKTTLGSAAALGLASRFAMGSALAAPAGMGSRPLGRTGHPVRLFSLGGQATLEQRGRTDEAVKIINTAIDLGVNYIDTAAAYGSGLSERNIGMVMQSRRSEVFLASKTHDRSYDGSMRLLEKSLTQLKTDHLDTWQLHRISTDADLEQVFARDGAIKALEKARDEKMVRFLGLTGHSNPFVLKKAIQRYDFDSILVALNAADKHHLSFIDNLLPVAVEKQMGIIGMKVVARGRIFREGGLTSMEQAMRYVLTLPISTVIVGISNLAELQENVQIATDFHPYTAAEMQQLEDLTKPYYSDATWFKDK
jgi:aryl-alcohol dehydrogenase-like predicted oxidoreductase